ncbi:FkbM family methyltransferase [Limnobacter sp.]|uniref:FkbM family methyltransferase n=1 Tax=Limnobacter sp. TaxID=2003368 RepID=UPI0035183C2F
MTEFKRSRAMHQYYRDSLVQTYFFDEIGKTPKDTLISLIDAKACDPILAAETLHNMQTGLPPAKDLALRQMVLLIAQSHLCMDKHRQGLQTALPAAFGKGIRDGLMRVLQKVPSPKYLINAIQILYRVGEIDEAMALLHKNPQVVDTSAHLQQIAAMVYTMEERYEEALPHLLKLVDSGAHQNNSLIKLMSMACMYKLGALPDEPVDFASLASEPAQAASAFAYTWVIEADLAREPKPTVVLACDNKYFYEHALAHVYSLADTNAHALYLHLHLYNPNASVVEQVHCLAKQYPALHISASQEHIDLKSPTKVVAFACRRFAVAQAMLEYLNTPVVLMDADALWRKPWQSTVGSLAEEHDVMVCQPPAAPFWEHVAAGFVYLNNTPAAKRYIAQAVAMIEDNLNKGKALWFLDQIALSACHHESIKHGWGTRFASTAPAALMDVNHGEAALTWVVTNQKQAAGAYADYKCELQHRHGQQPYSGPSDAFLAIGQQKQPVRFLQVGAMDGVSYDPIHPFVKQFGWQGVLVEPLPDMLERTRNNYAGCQGLVFENVAITDRAETKKLYRIRPETIIKHKLPDWLKGMSTFSPTKLAEHQQHVTVEDVQCLPLMRVIERNSLERIDVFQIDTEGYDYTVFKQLDFARFRPTIINMEVVNLSDEENTALERDLHAQGYVYYRYEFDLIALDKAWFIAGSEV